MRIKVRFVSAPCSTGKTHAACQYIRNNQYTTNHIYVAPSLELLKQTSKTMESMGVKPTVITSETHPRHVKSGIIEHLKSAYEVGEVLLITWQAYVDLPFISRPENWQVIIDEVPQLDRFHAFKLPRNLAFLTDHVDLELRSDNGRLGSLAIKDRPALEALLEAERDDVNELFRDFRDLLSPNKLVFADVESW